jgi:hypothetical protein
VQYRLTGGSVANVDSTSLTLNFSTADFNALQFREDVATGRGDTWLSLDSSSGVTLVDMNNNAAENVTTPIQARQFTDDRRAATLVRSEVNMNGTVVTLVFSETMNASSFDASELVLLGGSDEATSSRVKLQGENAVVRTDATTITVSILKADQELIKADRTLCSNPSNCFVAFSGALVGDQSGVSVVAVSPAVLTTTFVVDGTAPELLSFGLNMSSAVVALSFSETILGESVEMSKMCIQDAASHSDITCLGGGSYTAVNATALTFELSVNELNLLKQVPTLATATGNTYIKLLSAAVSDMASNPIAEVVRGADDFRSDTIPPQLVLFNLSMAEGVESLTLLFDETVNITSLKTSEILLESVAPTVGSTSGFNLSSADPSISLSLPLSTAVGVANHAVNIQIPKSEVDTMKRRLICITTASCYLSITLSSVTDMEDSAVVPVLGMQVTALELDITGPTIESFQLFSYDLHILMLSFSEPIEPSTLNVSFVELHSAPNLLITDPQLPLTGGSTTSARGAILNVTVLASDLNLIKKLPGLCKTDSACYLRATNAFVKDVFGNDVVTVDTTDIARKVVAITSDTEGPMLARHLGLICHPPIQVSVCRCRCPLL